MIARAALALLAAASLVAYAAATDAPSPTCPATNVARLGLSYAEMLQAASAAAQSADDACVARGLALADWLDRQGALGCPAADRLAADGGAESDPDLLAFRAALEWRCGRPRAAHDTALAALERDRGATLAWQVLGEVLEARFRRTAAGKAYQEVLSRDGKAPGALMGLARISGDRARSREYLERYLESGPERNEPVESLRGAGDSLDFLVALGDRPLWELESSKLPGEIRLTPISPGPGVVTGWVAQFDLGKEKKIPTLLDSGAAGLHLDDRLGKKAGVDYIALGTLVGGGGSGQHGIVRGTLARAVLGPLTFRSALGVVASGPLHSQGVYRAILGLDVFGGTLVRYAPERGRLYVEDALAPEDPEDPLLVDPWPAGLDELPVLLVEGQLLVPAALRATGGEAQVLALVDTGAAGTILDAAAADRLGSYRRGDAGSARAYGGAVSLAGVFPSVGVEVGSIKESLKDVAVIDLALRARLTGVHVGAFIGQDVWRRNGFELDLAEGTLRPIPR